jgi:hypothetical protein
MMRMAAPAKTASKAVVNLLSRSRIRILRRDPLFSTGSFNHVLASSLE